MSGIATGTALAIGLGVSGAASAAGSIAAGSEQAGAAKNAQNIEEQQFLQNQANEEPFINAGQGAVSTLSNLVSTPGQGLLTPWNQSFTPPTIQQAQEYPGYQFQLQQGENALQNSAAAKGTLLSGATAKGLINYGQQAGQSDYTNVYNQEFQNYLQNYQQFQQNQANTYNRLYGVSQLGAGATSTLGQQGVQSAANIGQQITNAGAATASGIAGATNAVSSTASTLSLLQLLQNYAGAPAASNYLGGPGTALWNPSTTNSSGYQPITPPTSSSGVLGTPPGY